MTTQQNEDFDVKQTQSFLASSAKAVGKVLVNQALKLWFVIQSPSTPLIVKGPIAGALVYLGCPIDVVPDIMPFVGWSDDGAALASAMLLAQQYVTTEMAAKADRMTDDFLGV